MKAHIEYDDFGEYLEFMDDIRVDCRHIAAQKPQSDSFAMQWNCGTVKKGRPEACRR